MSVSFARRCLAALCFALALAAPAAAQAAEVISAPEQLTSGDRYDRNPSVVVDGEDVWVFFARSNADCDRLEDPPTCNPDQLLASSPPGTAYDLMAIHSADGGATYDDPEVVAPNPTPLTFRGRTIAATQTDDGDDPRLLGRTAAAVTTIYYYFKEAESSERASSPAGVDEPTGSHFNVEAVARTATRS